MTAARAAPIDQEADAVAREAISRMKAWLKLPETDRPTLGVITFNAQQQSLILDLLDAARREEPELEWFFVEERVEPTIVKNLENVQGDERGRHAFLDHLLEGYRRQADDGLRCAEPRWRRTSLERRSHTCPAGTCRVLRIHADQIDPTRTKALAVHHLKTFLDYAERGPVALPAADIGSVGGFEVSF